jgi:hypothetical protein
MTMTTSSRTRRASLGLAGLALLTALAGCSTGSGTTTAKSSQPPAVSATPGPASTTPPAPVPSRAAEQRPVPVESNPPGDIPDNLAFVPYSNRAGGYSFTFPEGWARTERGTAVTFTDKLNGIEADAVGAPAAPTVTAVRRQVVPELAKTQPAFELRAVEAVTLPAGTGVKVVYRRNSAPDAVTGRQVRDEVESYLVAAHGRALRLDLFGPVGADNVDAYRTISRSLVLS